MGNQGSKDFHFEEYWTCTLGNAQWPEGKHLPCFHCIVRSLKMSWVRGEESSYGPGFSINGQIVMCCWGSAPRTLRETWLWICQNREVVPHPAGHLCLSWCALDAISWLSAHQWGTTACFWDHLWMPFTEADSLLGVLMWLTWIKSTFNIVKYSKHKKPLCYLKGWGRVPIALRRHEVSKQWVVKEKKKKKVIFIIDISLPLC